MMKRRDERTRAAAGECIRLIGMLDDAGTQAASALAVYVGARLHAILEHGIGDLDVPTDTELEHWTAPAREASRHVHKAGGTIQ
ncbi:MAG TPA: hypothetical protein VE338_06835 [Ktedonobacterales bacterium]|nr:hypothetical protein [Ktedonobacterales bacterium]